MQTAHRYQLSPAAYRRLYRQAYRAGLNRSRHIDRPFALDAPTLTITLLAGRTRHTTIVTIPDSHDRQRDPIAAFRRRLRPTAWATGDLVSGPTDYQPTRLGVIATWSSTASAAPDARTWPLDPLDTAAVGGGLCAVYGADRLPRARQLATGASLATRWTSGGNAYYTVFRPFLPDETDCATLNH
jgi:hypothetical protein